MTDYTMPVLSEQEREAYIGTIKTCMRSISEEADENLQFEYDILKIALASLTAKPIEYLTWHQGCRAPDDCEDYSVVASKGKKSCDGSDAFPVYTAPPVPVKQEGEQ